MRRMIISLFFFLVFPLFMQGQVDSASKRGKEQEAKEIAAYIKRNKIKIKPTESGLYFIETKKGKGPKAVTGDSVTVHFRLLLLDGTVLEENTFSFRMEEGKYLKGWMEGISMMSRNGKAKLLLPSSLAYGENGTNDIRPYTPLVFDITVLGIKKNETIITTY